MNVNTLILKIFIVVQESVFHSIVIKLILVKMITLVNPIPTIKYAAMEFVNMTLSAQILNVNQKDHVHTLKNIVATEYVLIKTAIL